MSSIDRHAELQRATKECPEGSCLVGGFDIFVELVSFQHCLFLLFDILWWRWGVGGMENLAIPSHRLASLVIPHIKLTNPRDLFCPEVKILDATFPLPSGGKRTLCFHTISSPGHQFRHRAIVSEPEENVFFLQVYSFSWNLFKWFPPAQTQKKSPNTCRLGRPLAVGCHR